MSNTINTKGHLAGSGGVRGHSAGHVFPYVIVGRDDLWYVIGNGLSLTDDSIPYLTPQDAIDAAYNLLMQEEIYHGQ
jgi:hypothetical protein